MDPIIGGALIGGGFSLLGTGLGLGFGGGGMSDTQKNDQRFMNDFAWKQALRNEEFQKDLAYNGMQIRSRDAQLAGLHPLAALGVNPAGGGSFQSAFQSSGFEGKPRRDFSGVSDMGQNISRAMMAMKTPEERLAQQLQLENLRAEGDLTRAQAAESMARTRNLAGTGPGLPSAYGPNSQSSAPGWPERHILIKNPDGSYSLQYSPEMATSMMARPIGSLMEDFKETYGQNVFNRSHWRNIINWFTQGGKEYADYMGRQGKR